MFQQEIEEDLWWRHTTTVIAKPIDSALQQTTYMPTVIGNVSANHDIDDELGPRQKLLDIIAQLARKLKVSESEKIHLRLENQILKRRMARNHLRCDLEKAKLVDVRWTPIVSSKTQDEDMTRSWHGATIHSSVTDTNIAPKMGLQSQFEALDLELTTNTPYIDRCLVSTKQKNKLKYSRFSSFQSALGPPSLWRKLKRPSIVGHRRSQSCCVIQTVIPEGN